MAYTLTQWWEQLTQDLSNFEAKPWVIAARTMAAEGVKIEKNPTQGRYFEKAIEETSKNLGDIYSCQKPQYLPNVDNPEQFIFAVVYYQHLLRYENIDANSIGGITGWTFLKFVQNELPRVQVNAQELKRRIEGFSNAPETIDKLKKVFQGINIKQGLSTEEIINHTTDWIKVQTKQIVCPTIQEENPITVNLNSDLLLAPKTLAEHLSNKFLLILEINRVSSEVIGKIIAEIEKVNTAIDQIITPKESHLDTNIADLKQKIHLIQELLNAIVEDELSLNPQGFIKLIKAHRLGYKHILLETNGGAFLAQKVNILKEPIGLQKTYYNVELLIKWASYVTPNFFQKIITSFIPIFEDSDCKRTCKILALDYLNVLQRKLRLLESVEPKKVLIEIEDHELHRLLTEASIDELQATQIVNEERKKLLQQYQYLLSTAEQHKSSLEYIKGYHASLDKIIEIHDTWFVKLSNWIAETISRWFKTDASWLKTNTAQIIAEVRMKKAELHELEKHYQEDFTRTIETAMEISQKSPDEKLKIILNEKIATPPDENKYFERIEELKDKKARQAFLHAQSLFELKHKEAQSKEEKLISCTHLSLS